MRWPLIAVMGVVACAARTEPAPSSRSAVYLSPVEHLTRASMALRGVRPTLAELREVASDPGALPRIVDGYLRSPEFGMTVRELHDEVLHLRVQRPEFTPPPLGPLAGGSFSALQRSYFEEPLRLIEDVVMTDQPYTTIVTADYTLADRTVATVYGMPHSSADHWERTRWPDGRPAAGILVSDAFHMRYRSAGKNYERGHANAVARALVCHDFLAGDVRVDSHVNLADPEVVSRAVVENPSCAACHQTLDPLASYFFGFEQGALDFRHTTSYPHTWWHPDHAGDWFLANQRPPRYFGQDADGLAGLGQAIAHDPRFARCAAIHFASYLTEVPAAQLPEDWVAELSNVLESSRMSARQLARAIVLSDRFRVAADEDAVSAEAVVGYQKVRPAQLSRMLEALTGYHWAGQSSDVVDGQWPVGTIDYLDDDHDGFRVLAGGTDGFLVTEPIHTMSVTSSLVVRTAAYRAATFVVDHDLAAAPADRTLFTAADVTASDEDSVRAELEVLQTRIYGELAPDTDASYALFAGALAQSGGDARRAWIVTLTGMLSDLHAVYY